VTLYVNAYHKNRGVYEFSPSDDPGVNLRRADGDESAAVPAIE